MEKKIMKNMLFILLICVLGLDVYGQTTDWEFKRSDDGIAAYTRSREGSKFKEYKVEMTMKADLSQILAIFKDFEAYPDIFPGTSNVKALVDEPDHHVTYIKFELPFPIRDRDALFDNRISYDKSKKHLHVDIQCLTNEYETNPKLVQITKCDGAWDFYQLSDGQLRIEHNLLVEPGGAAPAWIVNTKTVDDPITTLKSLRKLIGNKKYIGRKFTLLE